MPPRVRAHELWRVFEPNPQEAQDDATRLAVHDMERAGIHIVTDDAAGGLLETASRRHYEGVGPGPSWNSTSTAPATRTRSHFRTLAIVAGARLVDGAAA